MSFQFSQNNQTNFTNTTTEKDPYPAWLPNYVVQAGDDWWKIARKMYPDLPEDKIAIKVQQLIQENKDTIKDINKLKVGDVLVNLRFVEGKKEMQKGFSKKTASVFDTFGKGTKKTLNFLTGKEDNTKNKAAKSIKANPQETQAKKAASKATTNAVKNMKVEEEEGLFDQFNNFMQNSEFAKSADAFSRSLMGGKQTELNNLDKWINNKREGIVLTGTSGTEWSQFVPKAGVNGAFSTINMDEFLIPKAGEIGAMRLGVNKTDPRNVFLNRMEAMFVKTPEILTNTKNIVDALDSKEKSSEEQKLQAEINKERKAKIQKIMSLYKNLAKYGYGTVGLDGFKLDDGKEGMSITSVEQIENYAKEKGIPVTDVKFKGIEKKISKNSGSSGSGLSVDFVIRALEAIAQKGQPLTAEEYDKLLYNK